jgi:predicted ArsR family transcriptional regulator
MSPDTRDEQVLGIASLAEPVRRDLYRFVVAQPNAVTREAAAAGAGVALHVAKFHLDKLVDEGLLDVEFARPSGRGGPGAGRPAKHYRRSSRELSVSIPERRYDLAGRLLAQAVVAAGDERVAVTDALRRAARAAGRDIGERARTRVGRNARRNEIRRVATNALAEYGFEPQPDDAGGITLVNCPFHALAQEYTDLICGMNLELMRGLVEVLEPSDFDPRLEPKPGQCCVHLHHRAEPAERAH